MSKPEPPSASCFTCATPVVDVVLSGELTVAHAEEIRDQLAQAVALGPRIRVHLELVTVVDLAFLQLLCATNQRLALDRAGALQLTGVLAVPTAAAAATGLLGCRRCTNRCPWESAGTCPAESSAS